MTELDMDNLSSTVEEIIFALEDRVNERFPDKKFYFTTVDFKTVKHILVKSLIKKPNSHFCTHCESTIDGFSHACNGFYLPSPHTRYWIDDQAEQSFCMKREGYTL